MLDKDHVGRHASGVNAGGVRRLGRDINEIPLSLAAMDWWHQIDQLLDIEDGFHQQFYVKVALDDAGANLAGVVYSNWKKPDLSMKYGWNLNSFIGVFRI